MNVTLFGNRLFAEDQVKARPVGWTLIQQECGPYTKGEFDAETHTGHPVQMKAEIGVIHGRAEECQDAGKPQTLGRGLGRSSLTASEEPSPAHTLISDFRPPERGDHTFLMFEPPSLR